MMKLKKLPFNLELLLTHEQDVKTLTQIKELSIFEGSSKNFNKEGFFSVEIFGKVGTEQRLRTFAYIDLKIPIMHPLIFKSLCDIKEFYNDILSSNKYAIWDDKLKDFVKSNALEGSTGMEFFLSHFDKLQFEQRESIKRQFRIDLIEKYRKNITFDKLLVLPAGIRDYEIDENGKPSEDEVNTYYRRILSLTNLITKEIFKLSPSSVESTRYKLQIAINDLYEYFRTLLDGKSKFIQGKWVSRKIFNSTRNVASTVNNEINELDDVGLLGFNETNVGLYQYAKATIPLSLHYISEKFIKKVFIGPNSPCYLVNKKTLKKELVPLDVKYYEEWTSTDGVENLINKFGDRVIRHTAIEIDNYYFGLLYKNNNEFKFIQDIDDVPTEEQKAFVTPISYCEMLYIALYRDSHTIPAFITRYPIANYGSIYPSYLYLKTTLPSEVCYELDDNWQRTEIFAKSFPVRGADFYDSMSPHQSHSARLGLDYDGDVCSLTCVLTEEAKEEVKQKLNSKSFYIDANGKFYFSAETDILKWTLASLTS